MGIHASTFASGSSAGTTGSSGWASLSAADIAYDHVTQLHRTMFVGLTGDA